MEPWKKILYISMCINFSHGIGVTMFSPFLPLYIKDLGVTDPQAQSVWSGIILGVTSLFIGLLAPLWGTISDKYGRKPLILRTTLGISIAALLMYFATNIYQLLILRILHGMCGGMMPAFIALVAFNLPKDKIGQGLGAMQSAVYSGTIIGPFIGGILSDWIGYKNVFLVISFATFLAGMGTLIFIHEPKRDQAKARSTVFHNIKLVISSQNLRMFALIIFFTQFALHFIQPILPLFIVSLSAHGASATMVGLVYAVTGFSTVLFSPYWGRAGDKRGHKNTLLQCLLFASIAFFPQALVTSAYQLLPFRAIIGLLTAGLVTSTQSLVVKNTKDSERGGVLGITHSLQSFGHAIGPLAGGLVGAVFGYRFSIAFTSVLLILAWYIFRHFTKK